MGAVGIDKAGRENAAAPVRAELRDGVLRLTLDRSASRNALSRDMMAALGDALAKAAHDGTARVIVIGGAPPAFCAGHDLRELDDAKRHADGGRAFLTSLMSQCASLMQAIVNHPRPVIADVRGMATAAGCQLVASCDLAVAAHSATFATPGVNIGLFCSTPMVALSRKVARNHAMEMLLTGEPVSAERALAIGLVSRVVADADMDGAVASLAGRIAGKSLMTLKTGKQAFYKQADMPLEEAYVFTADVMIDNMLRHDAREGVEAFLQKRAPRWRDE
jgi:enoyl-CoA hydratase/carnithine racemase